MKNPFRNTAAVFFEVLDAQASMAVRAARAFQQMSGDFTDLAARAAAVEEIEHEADDLTHQLANKLDATFVTPLDKEDLRKLSGALDDITDLIEAGAQRLVLYNLTEPRDDLAGLAGLLVQIAEATHKVVGKLRKMKGRGAMQPLFIRVHELENESDRAFRCALADLFNVPDQDPLYVMKWKEIYDHIETAVDKCEDVANIVESVVVKYA
jgi:hypothetical protein